MRPDFEPEAIAEFRGGMRWILGSSAIALVGLAVVIAGYVFEPQRTAYAYLVAYTTCLTIAMGGLIFLAIVHAMNAKWPVALRRLVESMAAPLPILAVAFIPIAVWAGEIYPWVEPLSPELPHHLTELLEKKKPYLQVEFFWGRAAFYLVCWVAISTLLLRWSSQQDRIRGAGLELRQRMLSAASLPLLALTLTFAAFDWVMSLDPAWFSTVFGIYVFAGGFIAALSVLTIATGQAERGGWLRGLLRPSHYYALGRLMLAFVVFWAYISFFQFMLIWIANRPEEVAWFIERSTHGWQWFAAAIVFLHFVVPFVALLSYAIKWRPRALSVVAAIIIVAHVVEVHWMVVPAGHFEWLVHWVDIGALMLIAGTCVAFSIWRMRGRPMAPRYDAALPKGVAYQSA